MSRINVLLGCAARSVGQTPISVNVSKIVSGINRRYTRMALAEGRIPIGGVAPVARVVPDGTGVSREKSTLDVTLPTWGLSAKWRRSRSEDLFNCDGERDSEIAVIVSHPTQANEDLRFLVANAKWVFQWNRLARRTCGIPFGAATASPPRCQADDEPSDQPFCLRAPFLNSASDSAQLSTSPPSLPRWQSRLRQRQPAPPGSRAGCLFGPPKSR
jgi:hypothetical protein